MKLSVLAAEVGKDGKPSRPPERLYGAWTAKDVDAKMGEVKIRLTFRRELVLRFKSGKVVRFDREERSARTPKTGLATTCAFEQAGDKKQKL